MYTHTHKHTHEHGLVCGRRFFPRISVLYKESVFRGLQCGDAWRGGVKLPVKPTETGKGHRKQHTRRVSLCFLTVSVLSVWLCVCVGWSWGGCECVSMPLYFWKPHGMTQRVHWNTWHDTHGGPSVSVSIHWPNPFPSHCRTHMHIHTSTQFSATTHTCTHVLTKLRAPHMVPVLTLSFHCPKPEVINNQWWIHL